MIRKVGSEKPRGCHSFAGFTRVIFKMVKFQFSSRTVVRPTVSDLWKVMGVTEKSANNLLSLFTM